VPFDARSDRGCAYHLYTGGWSGAWQLALETTRLCGSSRLFSIETLGESGRWRPLEAHPGTADHEVLSWEIAELVGRQAAWWFPAMRFPRWLNQAPPGIRPRYNGLPQIDAVGRPPSRLPETSLPSDGQATLLHVTGSSRGGRHLPEAHLRVQTDRARPFCNQGPHDYVSDRSVISQT
jgi:hypothetical protein